MYHDLGVYVCVCPPLALFQVESSGVWLVLLTLDFSHKDHLLGWCHLIPQVLLPYMQHAPGSQEDASRAPYAGKTVVLMA